MITKTMKIKQLKILENIAKTILPNITGICFLIWLISSFINNLYWWWENEIIRYFILILFHPDWQPLLIPTIIIMIMLIFMLTIIHKKFYRKIFKDLVLQRDERCLTVEGRIYFIKNYGLVYHIRDILYNKFKLEKPNWKNQKRIIYYNPNKFLNILFPSKSMFKLIIENDIEMRREADRYVIECKYKKIKNEREEYITNEKHTTDDINLKQAEKDIHIKVEKTSILARKSANIDTSIIKKHLEASYIHLPKHILEESRILNYPEGAIDELKKLTKTYDEIYTQCMGDNMKLKEIALTIKPSYLEIQKIVNDLRATGDTEFPDIKKIIDLKDWKNNNLVPFEYIQRFMSETKIVLNNRKRGFTGEN